MLGKTTKSSAAAATMFNDVTLTACHFASNLGNICERSSQCCFLVIEQTARNIIEAKRKGDKAAFDSYQRLVDRLGRALAGVINILDPDIIVLGGGLSNVSELYADLPTHIMPLLFSDVLTTPILPARHGDSSGVRGAALLWR